MPSRPDLRDIASNVKDAFGDADRETLLDVLTFVVKEYVVEGPPPMLIHQAETLADLQNASFAQLITALQTRFDHPELSMFVVDGDHVSVRVGGVVQPLLAGRQPLGGAADLPRPQVGVRVVETTLQQRPPSPVNPQAAATSTAPPPRGLSIRGQPSPTPGSGSPLRPPVSSAPSPPPPSPPSAAPAPPPPAPSDKSEPSGDDAAARFSLLELD
jgi:hypothetical protein